MRNRIILILVLIIAISALVYAQFNKEEIKPAVGFTAPDFTLTNLDGDRVKLSDFRGKVVFLNFWATWCGYCTMEMPDLQKIHHERGEEVVVLTVNWTSTERSRNPEVVKNFVETNGYTFPVLLDTDGKVAETYLVRGIPLSIFIDKKGVIAAKRSGTMTYDLMNEYIDHALGL
jgi:peroxiredoxin